MTIVHSPRPKTKGNTIGHTTRQHITAIGIFLEMPPEKAQNTPSLPVFQCRVGLPWGCHTVLPHQITSTNKKRWGKPHPTFATRKPQIPPAQKQKKRKNLYSFPHKYLRKKLSLQSRRFSTDSCRSLQLQGGCLSAPSQPPAVIPVETGIQVKQDTCGVVRFGLNAAKQV